MRISDWSSDVCSSDLQACRELFEDFLLAQDIPRNTAATPGLSFGWTTDRAGTGDGFVGSYGRVFDVVVVGRPGTAPAGPRMTTLEARSEEHTSELQSLMRISYAVFCLKKKTK